MASTWILSWQQICRLLLALVAVAVCLTDTVTLGQRARPDAPLPSTAPVSTDAARDIVLFAAGAVEARPPLGWWIREIPYGREVRLLITPVEHRASNEMPADGIWLTYHAQHRPKPDAVSKLPALARRRARLAAGRGALLERSAEGPLAGCRAAYTEYQKTVEKRDGPAEEFRGSHVLALTAWGFVELHFSAPLDRFELRSREFQRMLRDLRLAEPRRLVEEGVTTVKDAADILGVWKAFRSRMRLLADGGIEIELDRSRVVPPRVANRPYEYVKMSLRGRFRAQQDLLFVEWEDGSKLNFRWRLDRGNLLLTDHEGQISLLYRLYE